MTKTLDSDYFGSGRRIGNQSPSNGGSVETTNPKPLPEDNWRPESGRLVPNPGQFVGSEPGGPASGEPIMPERGSKGI
jgi:hypothetical protein